MAGIGGEPSIEDRMITQEWSAAINNGFSTGGSTLSIPINRTLPYEIIQWGSIYGSFASTANPGVCTGMSDSDSITCARTSGSTSGDAAVYGMVKGVPL